MDSAARGTVALLTVQVQLWLGFARRWMSRHCTLSKVCMATICLAAPVSLRLAFIPSAGPVFGVSLAVLAVVWLLTTGMVFVAIRRRFAPESPPNAPKRRCCQY